MKQLVGYSAIALFVLASTVICLKSCQEVHRPTKAELDSVAAVKAHAAAIQGQINSLHSIEMQLYFISALEAYQRNHPSKTDSLPAFEQARAADSIEFYDEKYRQYSTIVELTDHPMLIHQGQIPDSVLNDTLDMSKPHHF